MFVVRMHNYERTSLSDYGMYGKCGVIDVNRTKGSPCRLC